MSGQPRRTGGDHLAKNLPLLLARYLGLRGRYEEIAEVSAISVAAARRLRHQAAEGEALNNLGAALAACTGTRKR